MTQAPFGILNVDKPAGCTSRDVVDRVQRMIRPPKTKVGHAGTLDPLATGVLVLCLGPATRLIEHVRERPKTYRATFLLGLRSDTDDVTGEVVESHRLPKVDARAVDDALAHFRGRIEQVPPRFSAVRVRGRRAYDLARRGETVALRPRTVEVYRLEVVAYDPPTLVVEIDCSAGTYVRSIGRDLGDRLGCGAVMSALVRTRVGPFLLEDAVDPNRLTAESLPQVLLPPVRAVAHLPRFTCRAEDLDDVRHGRELKLPHGDQERASGRSPEPGYCEEPGFSSADEWTARPDDRALVAVLTPEGWLACLARFSAEAGTLHPERVFLRG